MNERALRPDRLRGRRCDVRSTSISGESSGRPRAFPVAKATKHAAHTALRAAFGRLLHAGEPVTAADCLQALIRRRGASAPIHDRYRELLVAAGDLARLDQHGREYIATLLALGQDKRALAMLLDARGRDPSFAVEGPEELTRLLRQAQASGHSVSAPRVGRSSSLAARKATRASAYCFCFSRR